MDKIEQSFDEESGVLTIRIPANRIVGTHQELGSPVRTLVGHAGFEGPRRYTVDVHTSDVAGSDPVTLATSKAVIDGVLRWIERRTR